MRGYTSEQRLERKEAVKRAEFDRTSHMIVLAAREALIREIAPRLVSMRSRCAASRSAECSAT
jgi:hypothetical protein